MTPCSPHPSLLRHWLLVLAVLGLMPGLPTVAQAQSPTEMLQEFQGRRDDGVSRLATGYAAQLEPIKQRVMAQGSLAGANAVDAVIRALQARSGEAAEKAERVEMPEELPVEVVNLLKEHASREQAALTALARQYLGQLEQSKAQFLRQGNLEAANAAAAAAEKLAALTVSPVDASTAATAQEPITVEAYIDGNTSLHVGKNGLHWVTRGNVAKPGLHEGSNFPTYINKKRWVPQWQTAGSRGTDVSAAYALATAAPNLKIENIKVSKERFGRHEEGRTPVKAFVKDDQFIVEIADPEYGARWYSFRLVP